MICLPAARFLLLAFVVLLSACASTRERGRDGVGGTDVRPDPAVQAGVDVQSAADVRPEAYGSEDVRFEMILDHAVPFARRLLAEQESFFPFGVAITSDSILVPVMFYDEAVNEGEVAQMTMLSLRQMAEQGLALEGVGEKALSAAGVCLDILTQVPGREGKTDAISVILENEDGRATSYVLPYTRAADSTLTYLDPYYRDQPRLIFPPEGE